jgi:hypothetical protein
MDGKYRIALGALTLIVVCVTALFIILLIILRDQATLLAWGLVGLIALVAIIASLWCLNEMSLRRRRFDHRQETPLDRAGYPTLLQEGQQAYPYPYYAAQPHDWEESRLYE